MKIHKEGYQIIFNSPIIFIALFVGLFYFFGDFQMNWMWAILAVILVCKWFFVITFFREPKRVKQQDLGAIFSPADGTVVAIEQVYEKEYLKKDCIQVSVFMSVTNVHINWSPVEGVVEYYKYHPGKFLLAWHPKSSEENERTTTVVKSGGHDILFRQIAGFVARRIVNYVKVGEKIGQNDQFGFIKFGSRIDLYLPLDSKILVKLDEKVTGSQTKIALLTKSK